MVAMQFRRTLRISPEGRTNQSVAILLGHQLSHDASGTDQLAALAGIQLNVVDHGTDGDVLEGQGRCRA